MYRSGFVESLCSSIGSVIPMFMLFWLLLFSREDRLFSIYLKSSTLLAAWWLYFLIYDDFFERERKVRRDTELLDAIDPDCIVTNESVELLEWRLFRLDCMLFRLDCMFLCCV